MDLNVATWNSYVLFIYNFQHSYSFVEFARKTLLMFVVLFFAFVFAKKSRLGNDQVTNIVRLAAAVESRDDEGVHQIVFYDTGLGTENGVDGVLGAILGDGLHLKLFNLYTFLALNYEKGDEVYLFGFGRGALLMRSLAACVHEVGLVRRERVRFVADALELYRNHPGENSQEAVAFRSANGERVPFTLLACIDTVAALDLRFGSDSVVKEENNRSTFHETALMPSVANAIHVLAVDEDRIVCQPLLMHSHEDAGLDQLTQLFFCGSHSGVGGGKHGEIGCANTTLRFIVDEMSKRNLKLKFDMSKIPNYDPIIDTPIKMKRHHHVSLKRRVIKITCGKHVRRIDSVSELHPTVILRYQKCSSWRPEALQHLHNQIMETEVFFAPFVNGM